MNDKRGIKTIFKFILRGMAGVLALGASWTAVAQDRPNILVFWDDDIGITNISAYLSCLTLAEQLSYVNSLIPAERQEKALLLGDEDLLLLEQLAYCSELANISGDHLDSVLRRFEYWLRWHQPGGNNAVV